MLGHQVAKSPRGSVHTPHITSLNVVIHLYDLLHQWCTPNSTCPLVPDDTTVTTSFNLSYCHQRSGENKFSLKTEYRVIPVSPAIYYNITIRLAPCKYHLQMNLGVLIDVQLTFTIHTALTRRGDSLSITSQISGLPLLLQTNMRTKELCMGEKQAILNMRKELMIQNK